MDGWDILIQLLPYYPWIVVLAVLIFVVTNWRKIKLFWCDIVLLISEFRGNSYLSKEVNPAIQGALRICEKYDPIMKAFGKIIFMQIKVKKNVQNVQLKREKGMITAIIPSRNMDNVIKAIDMHFSNNLSNFSIVRDHPKLERALEVVGLQLVIGKCNLDGALEVSMMEFLNRIKEDEEIRLMFDILVDLNSKLKQFENKLDSRLLRILLIETCRAEFNALGKMLL